MALVTLPKSLTSGTTALGSDVLANDQAIVAQVNGNLEDANIKPGAAINGSKLSNVGGNRVPSDRIEDGAIVTLKIADANVTKPKLASASVDASKLDALAVIAPKVKTAFFDWSPTGNLGSGATDSVATGIVAANVIPLMIQTHNAGAPSQTTASFVLGLHLNTSTGFYHLTMVNADSVNIHSRTGLTFRFYYIPLS